MVYGPLYIMVSPNNQTYWVHYVIHHLERHGPDHVDLGYDLFDGLGVGGDEVDDLAHRELLAGRVGEGEALAVDGVRAGSLHLHCGL